MAELQSQLVKRGLWTNWDQGAIMGKTITTDTRNGTILVALLAVISTFGVTHLWNLIVFSIHQIRADGRSSDGLFHQQQVLLRTLPSPIAMIADSLKLGWAWRRHTHRPYIRTSMPVLFGLLFATATVAISIFSSLVVSTSNLEVLVESPFCGFLNTSIISFQTFLGTITTLGDTYADQCYVSGTLPSVCNVFTKPKIDLFTKSVPCPFGTVCATKDAFFLDSGLLDVGQSFGLNLPTTEAVKIRQASTCAVLSAVNRTEVIPASKFAFVSWRPRIPGEEYMFYNYGPTPSFPNATWGLQLLSTNTSRLPNIAMAPYYRPGLQDQSSFNPIPELKFETGDTLLVFLVLNAMRFRKPINDPLFAAHRAENVYESQIRRNWTIYMGDLPAKGVGCLQQTQLCHARRGGSDFCTEFGSIWPNKTGPSFPDASKLQQLTLDLLIEISTAFQLGSTSIIQAIKQSPFASALPDLPDNQWVSEVTSWHNVYWSEMQLGLSSYAVGPKVRDPFADSYQIRPSSAAQKRFCQIQKMRKSGGFANINLFGLLFVITFSIFMLVIDVTLLKFLVFLSNFQKAFSPRIDVWLQDGIWQLQQRAHQAQGQGSWMNLEKDVPITGRGDLLPGLPSRQTQHSLGTLPKSILASSRSNPIPVQNMTSAAMKTSTQSLNVGSNAVTPATPTSPYPTTAQSPTHTLVSTVALAQPIGVLPRRHSGHSISTISTNNPGSGQPSIQISIQGSNVAADPSLPN
ncbi:hypothetical protein B0J11DRAFT_500902 [Dendryphion nanum]|uniref:Uncharacterized protein n=1 Tax=Dendryphion nanum TaxID=256645 RepID=A0A9P9EKS9_9PLEO|nr:hypothetical protein B0J11DRAFT_500902 [Dendryphion nanum]